MSFSVDLTVRNFEMQPINSWKDVTPFAGSVVAYKTNSYYLGASKGFVLEDESIQFGYIDECLSDWSGGEKGYNMTRLLKPKRVPGKCALIDSKLESSISMRLASRDEISLIGKAILADRAEFEYIFGKERVTTILERHLSRL